MAWMVEGLCRLIEGLCRLIEGLCRARIDLSSYAAIRCEFDISFSSAVVKKTRRPSPLAG